MSILSGRLRHHIVVAAVLYLAIILIDLILLRPTQHFFSYVGTGLPGLNQYLARINVSRSRSWDTEIKY